MASFVAFNDVECVYPMSGQYGRAPRILYYALILFVLGFRRQDWLTAGAAAACLIYGGATAVHALLLAPPLALAKSPIAGSNVTSTNRSNIIVTSLATDLDNRRHVSNRGHRLLNGHPDGPLVSAVSPLWSSAYPRSMDSINVHRDDLQHGSPIRGQRLWNWSSPSASILHSWLQRHFPI
ncbi:hypothetical protein N431DRAFT_483080 [Stipitochalara longipes BDJ]|nr:hypothetical protein N431DRAFT_483080 [Stipitochalara longipes BDJ]